MIAAADFGRVNAQDAAAVGLTVYTVVLTVLGLILLLLWIILPFIVLRAARAAERAAKATERMAAAMAAQHQQAARYYAAQQAQANPQTWPGVVDDR